MKKLAFVALCFLALSCQKKTVEDLNTEIIRALAANKGEFAIAFKDLQTGQGLLINEHTLFHAASTMKTPVMIEAFKQAANGKFSLSDSIIIKDEFKSIVDSSLYTLTAKDDSDTLIYDHLGESRTVHSLIYDMIIMSSNLATNILIEKVGAPNVQQTMREMGTLNMQVLRGVEDTKAYQAGLSNTTTAYDLMVIFEKMANGKAVDSTSSREMINILLDQKFNEIIPAQLPLGVLVAHKTGWITGVHHDSGIVFLPDGRKYVLVMLSRKLEDEKLAVASMAKVSKLVYDWMAN